MPKLILRLFNGRKMNSSGELEVLEDWGVDGPKFEIEDFVHSTYGYDIKFDTPTQEGCYLVTHEGDVYYDGMFYGDWVVSAYQDKEEGIVAFSQEKADLPKYKQESIDIKFQDWKNEFERALQSRCLLTWNDACGDEEPLRSMYETFPDDPNDAVSWYIEKYDLADYST